MNGRQEEVALAGLLLDRILPAVHSAMGYGFERYPSETDLAQWANGAIFGALSFYLHEYNTTGEEMSPSRISILYSAVCKLLGETLDQGGGDLDATVRRLAPELFA